MKQFKIVFFMLTTSPLFLTHLALAVPFCNGRPTLPRLAPLKPLFEFHKSFNPQNVLVIFATLAPNCRYSVFNQNPGKHIDMLWRINAGAKNECLEEVTAEERSSTLDKMTLHAFSKDNTVMIMDLRELNNYHTDLNSHFVNVTLQSNGKDCDARSFFQLGTSQKNTVIQVTQLFAEISTFLGIPTGVAALTIRGIDSQRQTRTARYVAR